MNIKEECQKLASVAMNNDNFEHFMEVAKEISKNYSESRKKNVKQVNVKIPNGTQIKTIYNEQYQLEQAFMIIFYHRYSNMINKMKTPAEIGTNISTSIFLTPAHYDPADKKISYQLDVIMREKSNNFANVMELCLHENRHAMQFKSFSVDNFDDVLDFDPISIIILKDYLVMQNGNYRRNHINSLMEIDANLYARGMSKHIVTQYFREHQEDLKNTDFAFKEGVIDNPFEELYEYGWLSGEYVLENGEKVDRAIMMDKNLRNMISSQLVAQYPMLNLIWKDGNFKTYLEIMEDKSILLQRVSSKQSEVLESPGYNIESITEKEKVERLYSVIIQSDPMLYLESLLSQKRIQYFKVKELFSIHPTLLSEYQSQITNIFLRKSADIDDSQINIFHRLASELNISLSDEKLPPDVNLQGQDENNFADLDEFIEFISPELINDSRFLALLRKYRAVDLPPEEYVEWVEKGYKKQIETTDIDPVDEIDNNII